MNFEVWGVKFEFNVRDFFLFFFSLLIFVLALQLMKASVEYSAHLGERLFPYTYDPISSLGAGWLLSNFILSGSPVAAIAISFFSSDLLPYTSAYSIIMGSRIGATFMVFFIGMLAYLRGRGEKESMLVGVIAFWVTLLTCLGALILGYVFHYLGFDVAFPSQLTFPYFSEISLLLGFLSEFVVPKISPLFSFLLSIGLIMGSIKLLDKSLPKLEVGKELRKIERIKKIKEAGKEKVEKIKKATAMPVPKSRPLFAFLIGLFFTAIAASAAITLTILVPFFLHRKISKADIIPYILGVNLSTFNDTLLVAMLTTTPLAPSLVMNCIFSTFLITLLIALNYRSFSQKIFTWSNFLIKRRRYLLGLCIGFFLVPFLLTLL